ncbi:50S ribosomal protein L17 [Dyadobacter sp. MSC1_007]|jgi:large subunit ribosomal protein L17|uniref:50S ribosomal protein L17 n=1 Tax=Dyadobacter sp. MSC1_007 TaxID=2909264 RepID=UPI00202F4B7B|nr:50S ribosomal protein L17 [Dyadobacter sp. MSC1_007]
MRHGKKDNHLGRTASHRKAMLSNMASSLIIHKRIETTLAKAKELRKYVEPLLTRAKDDSTHNRRIVFSYLNDKESTKELFGVVSDKIASRPGGYTRIIKLGNRLGDAAETALIELVDFNDALLLANADKPAKTRRSRRGGKKAEGADTEVAAAPVKKEDHPVVAETEPAVEEAPKAEELPGETEKE